MKKKSTRNIHKILLSSKYVNNYTKLLLLLNSLDFYGDYYIPNKKLERMLNTDRRKIRDLLHQAEEEELIRLFYRDRKRFFLFIDKNNKSEEEITKKPVLFDYNWLEDDELED